MFGETHSKPARGTQEGTSSKPSGKGVIWEKNTEKHSERILNGNNKRMESPQWMKGEQRRQPRGGNSKVGR